MTSLWISDESAEMESGLGSKILTTWIVGTMISDSSSLVWIAEGSGAVDRIPTKVWTEAGLKEIVSS
jgi:hypothetical protein